MKSTKLIRFQLPRKSRWFEKRVTAWLKGGFYSISNHQPALPAAQIMKSSMFTARSTSSSARGDIEVLEY